MAGPIMTAPELANDRIELKRFLFSLGITIVIYVVDAGVKNAFVTLKTTNML